MPNRERGSGLLSTVLAVAVVMGLVGLCSNVGIALWVRSTVLAVSRDAADRVASAPAGADLRLVAVDATAEARALLGREGDRVTLRWDQLGPDEVALHVSHPGSSTAPRMLGTGLRVGRLDEVIVLRREGPR